MTNTSLPLAGKRALVTGGARGIGAAVARQRAADGADVAITYENSTERAEALAAELRALGRRAIAIRANAADRSAVRFAVDRTASELGGLDILINNAGVARMAPFAEMSAEDIDIQIDVNVRGVFYTTQAALKHFGRRWSHHHHWQQYRSSGSVCGPRRLRRHQVGAGILHTRPCSRPGQPQDHRQSGASRPHRY